MDTTSARLAWKSPDVRSIFRTVILASCVAALSYLAARLGGALVLHPPKFGPLAGLRVSGVRIVVGAA